MGEAQQRVYNVGAMCVENAINMTLLSRYKLEEQLGCNLEGDAVLTFHPVTLEKERAVYEIEALMTKEIPASVGARQLNISRTSV